MSGPPALQDPHPRPLSKVARQSAKNTFPLCEWRRVPTLGDAAANLGYSVATVATGVASAGFTLGVLVPLGLVKSLFAVASWVFMKKVDDEPKVVVVTGASSGIGAALALEYARPSTHIHIIARNKERLDKVAHAIHLAGGTPHIHQLDLSLPSPQPITDLINRIDAEHGGIDLVIPAAGNIGLGEDGEGETKWDAAMAEKMVDLNVRGAARVIFAAWERMKERRKGKICVIASIAAWGGPGNFALYCSSKAYLYRFALHLRQISIPYNIQVTTVCPGLIDSAMTTSMRKLGSIVPKPLHSSPAKLAVHVRKAVKENRGVTSWPYHQGVAQYAFRGLNPVCEEIAVWVGVVSGGASDVLT